MSQQEENAAIGAMVKELKEEQTRLSGLQGQARSIGHHLANFGKLLSDPAWSFWVEESYIQGSSMDGRPMAVASLQSLDKERILALIKDLAETREKIRTLKEGLKEAGL
jgi:hypothetical protein